MPKESRSKSNVIQEEITGKHTQGAGGVELPSTNVGLMATISNPSFLEISHAAFSARVCSSKILDQKAVSARAASCIQV